MADFENLEIVNPITAGLTSLTRDQITDEDCLLLWDVDAQMWVNMPIKVYNSLGVGTASSVRNPLNINTTSQYYAPTNYSFTGAKLVTVPIYQPDQNVNIGESVTFGDVTTAIVKSDTTLRLQASNLLLYADSIMAIGSEGQRGVLEADIQGKAAMAEKLVNNLSSEFVADINDIRAGGVFNGSAESVLKIYQPNQNVSSISNVRFNSITVPDDGFNITGNLDGNISGNANTANSLTHILGVHPSAEIVEWPDGGITFDGSENKDIHIYQPDQDVSSTADVAFKSVNSDIIGSNSVQAHTVETDILIVNTKIEGAASAAEKLTHSVTFQPDTNLAHVREASFNGSINTSFVAYTPDQSLNIGDDVVFDLLDAQKVTAPIINAKGTNGIKGEINADEYHLKDAEGIVRGGMYIGADNISVIEANLIKGTLVTPVAEAQKVQHKLIIDSKSLTDLKTYTYDGSEDIRLTTYNYDDEIHEIRTLLGLTSESSIFDGIYNRIQDLEDTVASINSFDFTIVTMIPPEKNARKKGMIYLLQSPDPAKSNIYDEYIWLGDDKYECIGTTETRLKDLATKDDLKTEVDRIDLINSNLVDFTYAQYLQTVNDVKANYDAIQDILKFGVGGGSGTITDIDLSAIKGVVRIYKDAVIELEPTDYQNTDTFTLVTANPSPSTDELTGTPGNTLRVNGDIELNNGNLLINGKSVLDRISFGGGAFGDGLPVGTIIPYTTKEVPQGYLICDGSEVSRTFYNELFFVIGTSYGEGDGRTTFKIPDLRHRFIKGGELTEVGTYEEDGLPNIKGHFYGEYDGFLNTDGAFKTYEGGESSTVEGLKLQRPGVELDASLYNPIYGASESVRPKNIELLYIIKYTSEGTKTYPDDCYFLRKEVDRNDMLIPWSEFCEIFEYDDNKPYIVTAHVAEITDSALMVYAIPQRDGVHVTIRSLQIIDIEQGHLVRWADHEFTKPIVVNFILRAQGLADRSSTVVTTGNIFDYDRTIASNIQLNSRVHNTRVVDQEKIQTLNTAMTTDWGLTPVQTTHNLFV